MEPLSKNALFEHAVQTYADTLFHIALHHCARTQDAEDAVQDTYIKLLQCTAPFESEEHLKAWLIRVVINRTHDLTRAAHNKNVALIDTIPALEENGSELLSVIATLPEQYRNATYLHYYEGYTAAEIGQILNAPTNTVLSWLRRARTQLNTILQEEIHL